MRKGICDSTWGCAFCEVLHFAMSPDVGRSTKLGKLNLRSSSGDLQGDPWLWTWCLSPHSGTAHARRGSWTHSVLILGVAPAWCAAGSGIGGDLMWNLGSDAFCSAVEHSIAWKFGHAPLGNIV